MYDKAMETLDNVMNLLNGVREEYYAKLIKPFLHDSSYNIGYENGKLDIATLFYGVDNALFDMPLQRSDQATAHYIYKRAGAIYKGTSLSVSSITSLHKKDYKGRAEQWKKDLAIVYAPEISAKKEQEALGLLAEKQQKIIQDIRSTNTTIPMPQLLETFATAKDLFAQTLMNNASLYRDIAQELQEYKQQRDSLKDVPVYQYKQIQGELKHAFNLLLGIYDGLFAYVYDLVNIYNKSVDAQAKRAAELEIANVLSVVGPAIDSAITSFEDLFKEDFTNLYKEEFDSSKLLVGEDIGAMVSRDPQGIYQSYIFERPSGYAANRPTNQANIKEYVKAKSVRFKVGDQKEKAFVVPPEHKKRYAEMLENWQGIINAILQPQPIQPAPPTNPGTLKGIMNFWQ